MTLNDEEKKEFPTKKQKQDNQSFLTKVTNFGKQF